MNISCMKKWGRTAGIVVIYKGSFRARKEITPIPGFFDLNCMDNIYWFFPEYLLYGAVIPMGTDDRRAGVKSTWL
jgi:hypothetical protein